MVDGGPGCIRTRGRMRDAEARTVVGENAPDCSTSTLSRLAPTTIEVLLAFSILMLSPRLGEKVEHGVLE